MDALQEYSAMATGPLQNEQVTDRGNPTIVTQRISAQQSFQNLVYAAEPELLRQYFGEDQNSEDQVLVTNRLGRFLLRLSEDKDMCASFENAIVDINNSTTDTSDEKVALFMEREKRAQVAYKVHGDRFPSPIWHCCKNVCFATIATDPMQLMVLSELIDIHKYAERCQRAVEDPVAVIEGRRPGIGTSKIGHVAPSRGEREAGSAVFHGTERQKALREFAKFVLEVLPFLYGDADSPSGIRPKKKLCTNAICCILGVSRNFLYNVVVQGHTKSPVRIGGRPRQYNRHCWTTAATAST